MDSTSPVACRVAAQPTASAEVVVPMGLRFDTRFKPVEFPFPWIDGANGPVTVETRPAVPSRYRYRRSEFPQATGQGRPT